MNQFSNKCDQTFVFLGQNNVLHFISHYIFKDSTVSELDKKGFIFLTKNSCTTEGFYVTPLVANTTCTLCW